MLFPMGMDKSCSTPQSEPEALTVKTESTGWLLLELIILSPCAKLANHYYNRVLTHFVNFN